jgi:hypothetical protein
MKPLHQSSAWSGKTLDWIPPDTREQYLEHMKTPDKRKFMDSFGWNHIPLEDPLTYRFNSDGYRTEEFDQRENFVVIGCSFTAGVGVQEHYRWSNLVSDKLDLWCWNLGVAGAGSDTCYRVLQYWLPVLKPKFVVFLEPRSNRIELHDEPNAPPHLINWAYNIKPWSDGSYVKTWLGNDENMRLHAEKNRAAIQWCCYENATPVIMFNPTDYLDLVEDKRELDLGRDLLHPGKKNNQAFADVVYKRIINTL